MEILENVLSIEKMKHLEELGVNTDNASMTWMLYPYEEGKQPQLSLREWRTFKEPFRKEHCIPAFTLIDKYGYKGEYFFYCILMNDFKEAFNRVNHWRKIGRRFLPHAQPYRDLNNPRQIIPQWQKDLARWADNKWIFRSCEFKDFTPRKGFVCSEYFKIN